MIKEALKNKVEKKVEKSKSKDKSAASSKSKDKDKASSKSKDKDKKSEKSKASSKSKDKKKESKKGDDDTKSAKSGKSGKSSKTDKSKTSKSKSKDKDSKKPKEEKKREELPADSLGTVVAKGLVDAAKPDATQSQPFTRGGLPPQQSTTVQGTCLIHGKELQFYCENTESLICYDCTVMGPHNTQLHRISKMDEAFAFRFQTLNKTIHESLVPKRTQLVGQIVRLDTRLDEVKSVKQVIERDIRNEYAGVIERLKSGEGVKTAVLSHDLSEVQQDITRIDEILMFMEEITSAGAEGLPDQIAFLHHYRQMNENIEYAITKQFKVDIDVFPNDLPRELAERQLLIEHYEEQRRLLKFKDDVIWKMQQELKKKYDFYQDEFDRETRNEMEEWARLVDKYASELKKFDMVCAFCGQHMSDLTVNADCVENNAMFDCYTYFTDEEPQQHFIHKGRHWFGNPSSRQQVSHQQSTTSHLRVMSNEKSNGDQSFGENQQALYKKLVQNLTASQLQNLQRQIRTKDDLINGLFDSLDSKVVKPAEIMTFVNLFNEQNFREGIPVLQRFQVAQTPRSNRSRGAPNIKDVQNKVKEAVDNTEGGMFGLERALKTFSSKHNTVTQDQMLIAFNRVDAGGLAIDDVKDFFSSVRGGDELEIDDIMQVLNNH